MRAPFLASLLLLATAQARAADAPPKPPMALVVIDPEISQFNVMTDRVRAYMPGPPSMQVPAGVPILTGMAVAGFGSAVGQAVQDQQLQTFANRLAEPLSSQFTEEQVLEAVKAGVRAAFKREGIEDVKFLMLKDPTAATVDRFRHNKDLKRVLLIDNETLEQYAPSAVTLSGDYRQMRITIRTHSYMRNETNRLSPNADRRAVVVDTLPRTGPSHAVLADRVAEGGNAFLAEVTAAMDVGVHAAITTPDEHALRATDRVYWVNAAGAFSAAGKRVDHVDGRLRVVDTEGDVSVQVADTVL